jgi:hypothetical protein
MIRDENPSHDPADEQDVKWLLFNKASPNLRFELCPDKQVASLHNLYHHTIRELKRRIKY